MSFKSSIPADPISELLSQNDGLTILSNEDPNEDRLNFLLGDGLESCTDCATNGQSSDPTDDGIKVDITLRTQLGQAPAVMLFITDSTKTTDQTQHDDPLISICFEVGLNGRISTVDSSGLVQGKTQHYNGDSEMHGADDSGSEWELQNIHKRISRVLEISQDIGILVEWVLRWQRQRAVSG